MKEKELRRSLAVFPIGSVMKLTDLTARQIRYYEDQGLISPDRTEGNRRMYSLDDMDRLLEIKDYISDGFNIADIKKRSVRLFIVTLFSKVASHLPHRHMVNFVDHFISL